LNSIENGLSTGSNSSGKSVQFFGVGASIRDDHTF
jgi:hypothetical protein